MPRPDPLRKAARMVADGSSVDWAALAETHPELRSRLEIMERLAALARENLSGEAAGSAGGAASPRASSEPELPFHWGTLEARERVGAGSFGVVYRAFDPTLDREVALKLRAIEPGEADLPLLLDEARLLARVRHPNVLAIHGVEVREGKIGFWTDLLRGETLEERLLARGPLPAEEVARVGVDLASALAAVHDAGLIHGDVKTANAILEDHGRSVLMDFGSGTRNHAVGGPTRGTPLFMAPEVLRGDPPSAASDLYSLGAVLYRLLTGRYPIEADALSELLDRHAREERPALEETRPGLPAPLARGIERALSPRPDDRPVTASELAIYLRASFDSAPSSWVDGPVWDPVPGLPVFSTRFVGRRAELLAVRRLLVEPRLVTLIGTGGAGKTRLAHRVAQDLASGVPGGVVWVDLTGASSGDQVGLLVARALGIVDDPGRTVEEALCEHLAGKAALLVLDNCEQVAGACADLAGSLLSNAPRLRLLATSRVPLGVDGEMVYRVPSLSLPPPEETGARILDAEAVRFFVDRAGRGLGEFLLTPSTAPAVARIVRRVDGIPLAIELAAARVATLGAATIAERLDADFRLLSGRGPDLRTRQGTIQASIAWSYNLLRPAEAKLLERLAVMSGGFRLEAAESICRDDPGGESAEAAVDSIGVVSTTKDEAAINSTATARTTIDGEEVLDLLAGLVDASLVHFEPEPRPRYRLLDMVRAFAAERLDESGEAGLLRRRHIGWCLDFATPLNRQLYGPEQQAALIELDDERDNFRGALTWAAREDGADEPDEATSLSLCTVLRRYWVIRGHLREGVRLVTGVVARASIDGSHVGFALLAVGSLYHELGDMVNAERWVERAIDVLRRHDRRDLLAGALALRAQLADLAGDYDRSRDLLLDVCEIHRAAGNKVALATCVANLGVSEGRAGNSEACEARYREALAQFREIGDETACASIQGNLGYLAYQRGNLARARAELGESVGVQRRSANLSMLAFSLANSALVEVADSAPRVAQSLLLEACAAVRRNESAQHLIRVLDVSARLLASVDRLEPATRLVAASASARETARLPLFASDRAQYEEFTRSLRESLGDSRFAAVFGEGRTIPQKEMLAVAEAALMEISFRE